jgi:hypothetical protein
VTNLRRYFTHYRDTSYDRPWFAVGPVLVSRPKPGLTYTPAPDVRSGVYVAFGSHTFAAHRRW